MADEAAPATAGTGPGPLECRQRPCVATRAIPRGCPWAHSTDLAAFGAEDMRMLARAHGAPGAEAPVNAPVIACHKDQDDTAHPLRLCAGWLAVIGPHHLGVRMQTLNGRLTGEGPAPDATWPQLYADTPAVIRAWRQRHAELADTDPGEVGA